MWFRKIYILSELLRFKSPAPSAPRYVNTLKIKTMKSFLLKNIFLVSILVLTGCSAFQSGTGDNWVGFTESGQASFYADKHVNHKTASGELYKHGLKTAAHKKLPFGSIVKVTNTQNRKSIIVKINDRGPFVKGRIIDLSRSAFTIIGNTSSGVINVKIEVIQ
ncbi:septal ring lytic transglycosylase RlpA family protein [uncultured Desulfobacter sp.]|uniref:septal ring lytic transglycosylase RlpA family protein n=1 Tax=uncultured Desulfobacter sp. TaxID=240139 RepID=UPI002AAB29C6|nr:septal ring lytic transglycosylase RlpA family protein [uncultured Desulfobacter sp.]